MAMLNNQMVVANQLQSHINWQLTEMDPCGFSWSI